MLEETGLREKSDRLIYSRSPAANELPEECTVLGARIPDRSVRFRVKREAGENPALPPQR
jgi:hypothetical protein